MLHQYSWLKANLSIKRQIPLLMLVHFSVAPVNTGLCLSTASLASVTLTWLSSTSSGSARATSNSSPKLASLSSEPAAAGNDEDAAAGGPACLGLMFTRRGTVGVRSRENVRRHCDDFTFGVLVTAVQRDTATGLVKLLAATSIIHWVARTNDSSSVSVQRSSLDTFTSGTPTIEDVLSEVVCSVQQVHNKLYTVYGRPM